MSNATRTIKIFMKKQLGGREYKKTSSQRKFCKCSTSTISRKVKSFFNDFLIVTLKTCFFFLVIKQYFSPFDTKTKEIHSHKSIRHLNHRKQKKKSTKPTPLKNDITSEEIAT